MKKQALKTLIDVASGRKKADLVLKHCKLVDVYNHRILEGDIAIQDGRIAGVGRYEGEEEIDAQGQYAAPGFIDGHIHIESSYVSPEELGRLLVPCGTTTIVADPHEIVNVCGLEGMDYMLEAAKNTALDIQYMLPSCVPATPFEHSGAVIDAAAMEGVLPKEGILGMGEFMNYVGVIGADSDVLDKLLVAYQNKKPIDGHSPNVRGKDLNAYAAARIHTDHECSTVEEMEDRISRGMYVLLRQGSACHDLETLLKGLTEANSRRCLFCSDDRQPKTILESGHIDDHLRISVRNGVDPITAIQMASLNAAECFGLQDRGAIAPGKRADIVLLDSLDRFQVQRVFIQGKEVAREGKYLLPIQKQAIDKVQGHFTVKDFSQEKLKLHLTSNHVHTIDVLPDGVLTAKGEAWIQLDSEGNFVFNPQEDIAKVCVVERYQNTGNVAVALLRNYGMKEGAIAVSIAHDSHNIIAVGVKDSDMALAIEELIAQNGGIVLVKDGQVLETMPMPIGGIMSDQSGEWVNERLTKIHQVAHQVLRVNPYLEPVMVLTFMSLAVIPQIKLTDMGLFDVTQFHFIDLEITDGEEDPQASQQAAQKAGV